MVQGEAETEREFIQRSKERRGKTSARVHWQHEKESISNRSQEKKKESEREREKKEKETQVTRGTKSNGSNTCINLEEGEKERARLIRWMEWRKARGEKDLSFR